MPLRKRGQDVGLLLVFVAQLIGVVLIASHDEKKISFKDVTIPFRLWGLICKLLP